MVLLGLAFLGLAACGPAKAPAPSQAANSVPPHEDLRRIVDRYWDERAIHGNPLSPQFLADSLAVERSSLAELLALPRPGLNPEARLTYDIFKRQRELDIEGFTYPDELLPVNPFDAMPERFAREAADFGEDPLNSAQDYDDWLLRIDDFVDWTRQAIVNMRAGMRRGYTSPKVLMERTLPLLKGLGEDSSANVFYLALRNMPDGIKEPERTRLASSLAGAVKDKLLPAYRELHDFIQTEYLPRARTSLSLSALPLGPSWYAYRVKRATDTELTASEIHGIGVAEVERIRARLLALSSGPPRRHRHQHQHQHSGTGAGTGIDTGAGAGTGMAAGTAPLAGVEGLLRAYQELKAQALAATPALFSAVPQADFEIRAFAPGYPGPPPLAYQIAAPDRKRPAILYVNTAPGAAGPAKAAMVDFLMDAIPGRHFQSALQLERQDLPRFRRFGTDRAFVEGWALYAASLGEELGLYRDDEAKRNALLAQLKCAVALVVDTGLHANDWTRARAVDYLHEQLAVNAADADQMIDRFAALPGDALACTMGELKFQALRSRAQQVLGPNFDIREFHAEILKDGAMPLDILEAKMKLWLDARR